ncbi:MAG TPA: M2 family metallopeptidase [Pseudomonadota bacterium]|nr:M2 family metallopeptidase [Pseudomonadota bacterium]
MSRRCLPSLPSLRPTLFLASSLLIASSFASCTPCEPIAPLKPDPPPQVTPPPPPKPTGPTEADARTFMNETETQLRALWSYAQRVQFVQNTNITFDTEQLNAQSQEQVMELVGKKIKEAAKFDKLELPPDLRRKFDLLKLAQDLPSPADAGERAELAQLAASMETTYGKAKYCPPRLKGGCLTLDDLSRTLSTSRNYDELMEAWVGWHDLAKTLRGSYVRYVVLANKGAQNAGYADVGAMWRSRYDMPEDAFAAETERLWEQVKPLYEALHCYTRMKLRQTYGNRVPEAGPIPAHLLGNMWAQEWGNIFPLVAPTGKGAAINLKAKFAQKKTTPIELVKMGEGFFKSVGFDPLPDTFWKRSMFVRPKDRDVVCHASAWDITSKGDLRIKMCIELDDDNFRTVHHELGHDYYYWYYRDLPLLFQQGANDGFHEAIGDAIALSITPTYLQKIGLMDQGTQVDDTTFLLHDALEHVAFLPFGKVLDQWRWEVFSGKVRPEEYNKRWWELRTKYQGVTPPVNRTDADFDPGAKYHIPSNVPYARYFLARVLEFQFHRALCQAAGYQGPLHKCSIYGNQAAGDKMKAMLQLGSSKPWPEALDAIAGTKSMDGAAMLDYYAPLMNFLKEQTKSQKCGW